MKSALAGFSRWLAPLSLLCFGFATRILSLSALPLHNDEGLHLTRALAVWRGHPFWDITDGKIINHWWIALFYPQNAPVFAARFPNVLFAVLGMAAGYALLARLAGRRAAFWGVFLWATAPYLFFYERLAQSDASAGALVIVALAGTFQLMRRGGLGWALFVGVSFSAAVLMKFTAAPYALVIALLVLVSRRLNWGAKLRAGLVIVTVGVLAFTPPIAYLMLRGQPFFSIALGWLGSNTSGEVTWRVNLGQFSQQLTDFGAFGGLWAALFVGGLLGNWKHRALWGLWILAFVPLMLIIVLSSIVFPRHFIVTMPLLLLLSGAGWAAWQTLARVRVVAWLLAAGLLLNFGVWAAVAYRNPAALNVSRADLREYFLDHSAGFGLREAMLDLPNQLPPQTAVIGSMFPTSCQRANFYARAGYTLTCADAPALDEIEATLAREGEVYILVERHPLIGVTAEQLNGSLRTVAVYPRPTETPQTATVALYHLTPID